MTVMIFQAQLKLQIKKKTPHSSLNSWEHSRHLQETASSQLRTLFFS